MIALSCGTAITRAGSVNQSATETRSTSVDGMARRAQPATATRPPAVETVPVLDLGPGDVARLPVRAEPSQPVVWSAPVTITRVLLIDTGLVEVRWATERPEDAWQAHCLLTGEAFKAGAVRLSVRIRLSARSGRQDDYWPQG